MVRYIDQSLREFIDVQCRTTIERTAVLIQQAWFDERDRKDKILIDGPEMELASGITTTTMMMKGIMNLVTLTNACRRNLNAGTEAYNNRVANCTSDLSMILILGLTSTKRKRT